MCIRDRTKGGGRPAAKRTARRKSNPKAKDTAFGWLEATNTDERSSTIVSDSAELSIEPTYVDLMTE